MYQRIVFAGAVILGLSVGPLTSLAELATDASAVQGSGCFDLSRNLTYRSYDAQTGAEVSLLQDFLRGKGLLNSVSTGFFGPLTLAAAIKYQKSVGLYAVGFVGPLTRAKIKATTCNSTANAGSSITLISPGEGMTTAQGQVLRISWRVDNPRSNTALRLTLSDQGNRIVGVITGGGEYATGGAHTYDWTVPRSIRDDSDAIVCVTDSDGTQLCGNRIPPGFYKITATLYTPENACFGFCPPGYSPTTLATASRGLFITLSAPPNTNI